MAQGEMWTALLWMAESNLAHPVSPKEESRLFTAVLSSWEFWEIL